MLLYSFVHLFNIQLNRKTKVSYLFFTLNVLQQCKSCNFEKLYVHKQMRVTKVNDILKLLWKHFELGDIPTDILGTSDLTVRRRYGQPYFVCVSACGGVLWGWKCG